MRPHTVARSRNALIAETSHPCTRALAVTREKVGIYYTYIFTVIIFYLISLDIGMIYFYIRIICKRQAIQFGSESEHTVNDIVQFKIRPQLLLVIIVLALFQLIGIITVVPCLKLHRMSLDSLRTLLYLGKLLQLSRAVSFGKLREQFIDIIGCLGHRLFKSILGISGLAEQIGDTAACIGDIRHYVNIGVFPFCIAAVVKPIKFLSQVTSVTVLHERHIVRLRQSKQIHALLAFLLCGKSGCFYRTFRKTRQVIGLKPYLVSVQLFQYILPELGSQVRQVRRQLPVLIALLPFKFGSVSGK